MADGGAVDEQGEARIHPVEADDGRSAEFPFRRQREVPPVLAGGVVVGDAGRVDREGIGHVGVRRRAVPGRAGNASQLPRGRDHDVIEMGVVEARGLESRRQVAQALAVAELPDPVEAELDASLGTRCARRGVAMTGADRLDVAQVARRGAIGHEGSLPHQGDRPGRAAEAAVGDEPHQRHRHQQDIGDPGEHERQCGRGRVGRHRDPALDVAADGRRDPRGAAVGSDDRPDQQREGDRGAQAHHPVGRGRGRFVGVLADPLGQHRNERQPEQQVQVGPHHPRGHPAGGPQQMVVVVPVDPDEREAQDVDQQRREALAQAGEVAAGRGLQLQGHDRDDHRQHAVAEGFQAAGLGWPGVLDLVPEYHRPLLCWWGLTFGPKRPLTPNGPGATPRPAATGPAGGPGHRR